MAEKKVVGQEDSKKVSGKAPLEVTTPGTDEKKPEGLTQADVKKLIAEAVETERRGWQSKADTRIAKAEKEAANALTAAAEAKARELALIQDPAARAALTQKYATEDMQRELDKHKRRADTGDAIASWVQQGIDPAVFEGADSPREIYERGLAAVIAENKALKDKAAGKAGDDEVKKLKESGALQVSTLGGPAPLITSQTELDKKRAETKARAQDPKISKRERTAARLEHIKLKAARVKKKG